MSDNKKQESTYLGQLHFFGRVTNIIVVVALLAVPFLLSLVTDVKMDFGLTVRAFFGIFSLMGILVIVEFMSYAPMLGAGATYLTFITGNTMNLKLPAAMSSVRLAGMEPNSEEADVIATMAVAVSSLVTIVILLVGMLAFGALVPILQSPSLKPAFDNLMPALMGALGAPVLFKDLRTASVPLILGMALTLILGYAVFAQMTAFALPAFLAITLLWRYILYRRDMKKAEPAA